MVVVMVLAAVWVVFVICSNLCNCMFCGGICGVGSGYGTNNGPGCSSLPHYFITTNTTTTTTITTSFTTTFTTQHTLTMALLVMVVVVTFFGL